MKKGHSEKRDFNTEIPPNTNIGQHFVINENTLMQIVELLPKDSSVLEIGAGNGNLTEKLVKKVNKIIAVEIDERFRHILNNLKHINHNFEVIIGNALKIKFNDYPNFWVVGNIPYHITEPLIERLITSKIKGAILMVGKSFASDVTGKEINGKLSIMAKTFFEIKLIANVSKSNFMPKPRTDSAIIKFTPKKNEDFLNNKKQYLLRRLFLTAKHNPLVKNSLVEGLIKFNIRQMTKNEARAEISKLNLPENILRKPFEQLNNEEYRILYYTL